MGDKIEHDTTPAKGPAGRLPEGAAARTGERISHQPTEPADADLELVREQPLAALMATGAVCFMLGTLFSRR
jgi:hypothetical protein